MCDCVYVCVWEMRGPFWPLGDRGSNEDVWLFQHPSADIFLPSFTPSVSPQHTSPHLSPHTYTHTLQQQPSFCHYVHYYSIFLALINHRRARNPELQWPKPRLSPCNGGKTFISLLSCPGPISALPRGYLDPLWLQIFEHGKGLIIIAFPFAAD